jgi:shikimate dehydrogenase
MPDYYCLGLIGHPLTHSLSPLLHTAALQFAQLEGEYCLIDIDPKNFYKNIEENLSKNFLKFLPKQIKGFNITIPYKEDIFKLLTKCTNEAKLVGAVNTIKVEKDGSFTGHNTDLIGFKKSFKNALDQSLEGSEILLIGAGGSAKAVAIGLAQMGVTKIIVRARNPEKVNSFIKEVQSNIEQFGQNKYPLPFIECANHDSNSVISLPTAIINASPIGLNGHTTPTWLAEIISQLPQKTLCFDLVYRKDGSSTPFLETAIKHNLKAIDGIPMLVYQAKHAFKYWTTIDVPEEIMFKALCR